MDPGQRGKRGSNPVSNIGVQPLQSCVRLMCRRIVRAKVAFSIVVLTGRFTVCSGFLRFYLSGPRHPLHTTISNARISGVFCLREICFSVKYARFVSCLYF